MYIELFWIFLNSFLHKLYYVYVLKESIHIFYFSGEILITNCDEEQSYAAQLIQYMSDAFRCPSPVEEFIEM